MSCELRFFMNSLGEGVAHAPITPRLCGRQVGITPGRDAKRKFGEAKSEGFQEASRRVGIAQNATVAAPTR